MEKVKEIYNYCLEDRFDIEDLENRRIYINDDIDEKIIDNAVYHIFRYNRQDKSFPKDERKPIIIYINSPGGSVTCGYGLIDAIMTSVTPVYTVNLAECYSMGFLIFLAGEKRFAMPSSTYLLHDGSSFAFDSMSKLKDRIEFETGQMEQYTKKYILSRTNIDSKLYDEKYRMEWYMFSDEAKSYNIVTHIIGRDCGIGEIL